MYIWNVSIMKHCKEYKNVSWIYIKFEYSLSWLWKTILLSHTYDKIKFKASWQNADDVDYYNMMIDEAYMNEPANKWSTNADEHLKMFYNEMDRAGLTWRQISINGNNSSSFEKDREKLSIKDTKGTVQGFFNYTLSSLLVV